jgi:peptidoglycan/xylan/chitin deacetylase (PgdA/CDA1 family)
MITRGVRRLRHAVRRPGERSTTKKVLILLYHRVARLRSDPWSLTVKPHHFAEHLEILHQYARPIRLQQLSQESFSELPDRSVVVTFDDGYADNLYNAKPLLERHGVPATVFVTTGYIGSEREYWWDELDRLLLQPGRVPDTLRLSVNGYIYEWQLGGATHYSEEASRRYRRWKIRKDPPSMRHRLYRSLYELLNPLPGEERRKVLDELVAWAGTKPVGRRTHRTLSAEEVVALAEGGLIEVGAHTVTHSALSTLPAQLQRDEIQSSKVRLEEILDRPVTSFAYPYGGRSDYTAQTVSIVQESGFSLACSNFPALVERSTDQFELPRVYAPDCGEERFAQWLSKWLPV